MNYDKTYEYLKIQIGGAKAKLFLNNGVDYITSKVFYYINSLQILDTLITTEYNI